MVQKGDEHSITRKMLSKGSQISLLVNSSLTCIETDPGHLLQLGFGTRNCRPDVVMGGYSFQVLSSELIAGRVGS